MIHGALKWDVYSRDSLCLSSYVVLELFIYRKERPEFHGLDIAAIHGHGTVKCTTMCIPARECSCPWRPDKRVGSPAAEGAGHCEAPNMGTGTQTQVL